MTLTRNVGGGGRGGGPPGGPPRPLRETSALSASLHYPFLLSPEPSASAFHAQLPHQIRNNHLPEDHRIRPHFHLSSQMPALRIDPSFFRNVATTEQQIGVRDRHLRVQSSRDDQHRRRRLPQQPLRNQRHLRENVRQIIHRFRALKNRHQRRSQPEKVFAISQCLVNHKIFLERRVRRRRLRHHC